VKGRQGRVEKKDNDGQGQEQQQYDRGPVFDVRPERNDHVLHPASHFLTICSIKPTLA